MKKLYLSIMLIAAAYSAIARPVGAERARDVAQRYFAEVKDVTPTGWTEMYVFAPLTGTGFVVVSADDCVRPVLAYSAKSQFVPDDMPQHVAHWFDGYRREIASFREAGAVASPQVQQEWAYGVAATVAASVLPLVKTTWSQSPRYNWECPYSASDSAHAVTGCVATATAQIMKYWNHPAKGHGMHGYKHDMFGYLEVMFDTLYQWDDMPNSLNWSSTEQQIHAVAQLMHHVGVAVEMGYGVNESGAHVLAYGAYKLPSSERALKEHFRYNPMMRGVSKDNFIDSEWDSLMRHEISHGRPVLYTGRDNDGGHAFVIDGYDTNNMFHVNWGWGGWYDGYYTLDSLSPGAGGTGGNSTYTFNMYNEALIQIFPAYGNDTVAVVQAVSSDPAMGEVKGNGEYQAYQDTITVMAVPAEGYRFAGWASGFVTNPLSFVPNGDFADTALFAALDPDSLSYSDSRPVSGWRDDYGAATEWGVRIPAARRNAQRSLAAVRLYVRNEGYYTLSVFCGDTIAPENRVYNKQVDLTDAAGWVSVPLTEPVPVTGGDDLWITLRFSTTEGYPAATSFYSGIPDGTWYRQNGQWVRLSDLGQYLTWMMAAVFVERDPIVTLAGDGFTDSEHLSGGGSYAVGAECTISHSYTQENNPFDYWDFGGGVHVEENPYTFTVTQDTLIVAVGHCIGIEEAGDVPSARVAVQGRRIVLLADEPLQASLYAVDGRLLGSGRVFTAPSAGVYLLRCSDGQVVKVPVK